MVTVGAFVSVDAATFVLLEVHVTDLSVAFDGATVLYTEALKSYTAASANEVFMIVGDLAGVQANLPDGEAVKFVYDEFSLAEEDLVRIIGRLYAAIGVTGPGMFANVTK